jgi:hypothetical protein
MNRIILVLLLAAPRFAFADEGPIRGGTEKFKLNLGTILNQHDTTIRVDGPRGRGIEFGLEDITGLQQDRWSTLVSGSWRFAPNHRVGFQSFSTRRHNERVIERELVIRDETIPVGTRLSTTAKTDFLIFNYQYSLFRDDRVELSALAGFYGARFRFTFDSTNPPRDIDQKATAPLPVFGLGLDTFITPRWTVSTFFEGLMLKVGDVKGGIGYFGLSTDYMLTRHLGLGVGLNSVAISVEATDNDFSGTFRYRTNSVFAYGQLRF